MKKTRLLIWAGAFACHSCKRTIQRKALEEAGELSATTGDESQVGSPLTCPHCGYENKPTARDLRELQAIYGTSARVSASTRRQVLERVQHRCSRCGSSECLQLHHKRPRMIGGMNDPDNLVVLCRHCHMELEGLLSVVELTERWLSPAEVAQKLDVKPATVIRWCTQNVFRHSRRGEDGWLISDVEFQRRKRDLSRRRRVRHGQTAIGKTEYPARQLPKASASQRPPA